MARLWQKKHDDSVTSHICFTLDLYVVETEKRVIRYMQLDAEFLQ